MKVLIAEDDRLIREGLVDILEGEGYQVITAPNGVTALAHYRVEKPDFHLLDIMMPGLDGYEVCKRVRREDEKIPIIFLSAKSEEIDRILGLELGADDFIMKPFGVKELIARIRAVARRCFSVHSSAPVSEAFQIADLRVCPAELRARRGERVIDLSLRDVSILKVLAERVGQVVDRDTFFRECWGYNHLPNSRTLDQHISKLRRRIEHHPKQPQIIRTVHGVGYRYEP